MVDLQEKLAAFKVKVPNLPAIMLPSAFIARTLKAHNGIPQNVQVIVERNCFGSFELSYWNEKGHRVNAQATKDSGVIDVENIAANTLSEILKDVSTDDLKRELKRRVMSAQSTDEEAADASQT